MVIAVATTVDVTPPWICHMLTVFVAAYTLARLVSPRVLAVALAFGIGMAEAWALGNYHFLPRVWFDAWVYWDEMLELFRPGIIKSDPVEFLGVLLFCWIAPILIAWLTVRRRRLSPTRPPDGGDASAPHTSA